MVRRRTRSRRRRSFGGAVRSIRRGAGGGGFGALIQGLIAGIASQVGQKFLPGYGGPLGVGATGYFTGNPTLMTLAGMQTSALLPLGGLLGNAGTQSSGGFI